MLKKRIKTIPPVLLLWNEKRRFESEKQFEKYSDIEYLRHIYKKSTGRELNLLKPRRYTEKLQWLKLFYRDPLIPICTDKYEVREYLTELGYEFLLNDLIGVYEKVEDINFKNLPNKFVIKASHGSGWNLVVKDKDTINWFWWKKIMKSWLKQNLYIYGREWNYDDVTPRIVIEKYLDDDSGELRDYKVFCFNGEPTHVQVIENLSRIPIVTYFKTDGTRMDMNNGYKIDDNAKFTSLIKEAIELARKLSKPFPHVRVDFYISNNKIYFGEFTFFNHSGNEKMKPDKYDYIIGDKLRLPKANYNMKLLKSLQR